MGILKIFADKIDKELDSIFVISQNDLALPKDIRRDPGGKFEVQPQFQYPEMGVPEYDYKPEVSEDIQNVFLKTSDKIKEAIEKISGSLERITKLESVFIQQGYEKDFVPLKVSYQNAINELNKIYEYFSAGAQGSLSLKLSQVTDVDAVMNNYVSDSIIYLDYLLRDLTQIFNYTKQNFDSTKTDVRALSWELAYAIQVARDQKQVFNNYLGNREGPKAKPPVQIQTPGLMPSNVEAPYQINPTDTTKKNKKPTVKRNKPETEDKPKVLDIFEPEETKSSWKPLEDTKSEQRLESIVGGLPEKQRNQFFKWMTNSESPQEFAIQLGEDKKILQVVKDEDRKKLVKYRITEFQYSPETGDIRIMD